MLTLVFFLLASHALFDFPLQGDVVAREKSRHSRSELQKHVPWFYWLTAHAFCHALGVALVTGSVWLGLMELVSHWVIDFFKCEGRYSIHTDQTLHLLCKLAWAIVAVQV
jgi:ABC-type transport system involved in cytochrome c biogenesis permease subunit